MIAKRSWLRIWRILGPGLITGAADDDPSGIATYSQAGAQFGYGLTWTMFLTLPFMAAIQIISACIGWGTQAGLTRNIAQQFSRPVVYSLVGLLIMANTINIAADLAAMGDSLRLVVGGNFLCGSVRCCVPRSGDFRTVSPLRRLFEIPDAGVVRLRGCRVQHAGSLGPGCPSDNISIDIV